MNNYSQINQELFPEGFKYAMQIIYSTPKFVDFSIALLDVFGEEILPCCKLYYATLKALPSLSSVPFDNSETINRIQDIELLKLYSEFVQKQDERNRVQEFKENIDELQFLIQQFRKSEEFQRLLDCVVHFHYLAPYNAMLVYLQKPGADFVLSAKKWEKYGQRPKINAQNLITLIPFGPIQCQYDISDVEPIPGHKEAFTIEMIKRWENLTLNVSGNLDSEKYDNLLYNLGMYGIFLNRNFYATNSYGAYIKLNKDQYIQIQSRKYGVLNCRSRWEISVNGAYSELDQFSCICHELGHLFCEHISLKKNDTRNLTVKEREFEAETVAWLVCRRLGIITHSEKYLATYCSDGKIPVCSLDHVMKAVTEIEKMLSKKYSLKESLIYKEDREFKELVNSLDKPKEQTLFD